MQTDFDIAVCGAGPVGLALALLLARRGLPAARIVLIDAKPLEQAVRDPRTIALSSGSRQILEEIGCWPLPAAPIERIHVSRRGRFGRTLIEAREFDMPALGYVARYGTLIEALAGKLAASGVVALRPRQVESWNEGPDAVELRLADGALLSARILVQAEGGVYAEQEARPERRDYAQFGLIAHVKTDAPQPKTAFERFTDEGPLALLPQDDGYALVWCARPHNAQRLQTLDDAAFLAELQQAFGSRLGRFTQASPRHAYPLGLNVRTTATARTVAIGNAAQTLHPVAGQGLNLGLRDAVVLARTLAQDTGPDALARFLAQRRTDRNVTIALTDTLARIFANPLTPVQSLLGLSLGLLDTLPFARRALAEHMMFGHR